MKFCLLTEIRSGTHMLVDVLIQHPEIEFHSLFTTIVDTWHSNYENYLNAGAVNLGVGVHYFRSSVLPDIYQDLAKLQDKTVCLTRHNKLSQFLSVKIAEKTTWECNVPREQEIKPLRLDPVEFEKFKSIQKQLHKVDVFFPNRLDVTYEELTENWVKTFAKIQEHIGVTIYNLRPTTIQQETRHLKKAISNYAQLI